MRIIIAGGSGLIGRALTSSLVNDGNELIVLSRNPGRVINFPPGVKILEWDGTSVTEWGKEIANTDVVINLVGENLSGAGLLPLRWTKERKNRILQSRVNAGKSLSQAIEMSDKHPAIFVQASGIGYYGTDRRYEFTEESAPGNDFLANLSKSWEASSESIEELGVRRIIIRSGVVLSSQGGALRPLLFPYKYFIGGPIGDGKQVLSWIHIDDVVTAIRFLISSYQSCGAFNLTSPNPVTNNDFGKTMSKVLNRPHYFRLPGFIMRLALGEVADMVLKGQTALPAKLLASGFSYKYPTLEEALKNLL